MIGRIPRETAAYAAGLASSGACWHTVAAVMAQIGLGVFRADEVEAAADIWSEESTSREAMSRDEAIVRTKPRAAS